MARNIPRTGKKSRPKTAVKGKRYRCARCRKRSPKPVTTPAPWYCPACSNQQEATVMSGGVSTPVGIPPTGFTPSSSEGRPGVQSSPDS